MAATIIDLCVLCDLCTKLFDPTDNAGRMISLELVMTKNWPPFSVFTEDI